MNDHDVLGISRRLLKFIWWELSSFGDPQFFGQNIKKKLESTENFPSGCVFCYQNNLWIFLSKMAAAVKANVVAICCCWCGHHFMKSSEHIVHSKTFEYTNKTLEQGCELLRRYLPNDIFVCNIYHSLLFSKLLIIKIMRMMITEQISCAFYDDCAVIQANISNYTLELVKFVKWQCNWFSDNVELSFSENRHLNNRVFHKHAKFTILQLCIYIFLQFPSLCAPQDVTKYEIICQWV